MVGSTLLAKGASGNYSIHHNYTNRTLAHRGQGTQILHDLTEPEREQRGEEEMDEEQEERSRMEGGK